MIFEYDVTTKHTIQADTIEDACRIIIERVGRQCKIVPKGAHEDDGRSVQHPVCEGFGTMKRTNDEDK